MQTHFLSYCYTIIFVVKKMQSFQLLHLLITILLTTTLIESKFFNNPECDEWCGDVRIHYPFGIGRNCAANKWYTIDCNSSTPYLPALNNVEVLEISWSMLVVTVNMSVIKADCKNPVTSTTHGNNPFRLSRLDNTLVFEGCGKCVMMDENRNIVSGCSTTCGKDTVGDINNCFGVGCCRSTIRRDLKSVTLNVTGLERKGGDEPCSGSAFLMNAYYARRFSSDFHVKDHSFFPISLSWKENLTESRRCPEYGISKKSLGVILGISIIMGLLFLMAISYVFCQINTKRKLIKMKQMYFKRNGGLLLKQRQESDSGLVDNTILFTSSELEKTTDHFNENRILGRGGQGTVYKGMLVDGRIVAIKKSKVIDERHIQQFINEVIILSQVNHRNVVKLLGCCLETEVPLLVSEFISNGTLYDFLQDETGEISISLNMRLQIATEVAGAISYLHSATSIPIYHRDVKTTNILLDEKYRAKVSDFGTSRSVSADQTHVTTIVKGTFGYLDPEYFQSNQFTEKSDVYSFGVVLLELFTREKPISSTRFGENRFLATHFLLAMEEGRVMSIFDPQIVNDGSRGELLVLANLAMRCLNSKGRNRPTMKEVGFELEGIRLSHMPSTVQTTFSDAKKSKDVPQMFCESTSTSLTFDDDLCR